MMMFPNLIYNYHFRASNTTTTSNVNGSNLNASILANLNPSTSTALQQSQLACLFNNLNENSNASTNIGGSYLPNVAAAAAAAALASINTSASNRSTASSSSTSSSLLQSNLAATLAQTRFNNGNQFQKTRPNLNQTGLLHQNQHDNATSSASALANLISSYQDLNSGFFSLTNAAYFNNYLSVLYQAAQNLPFNSTSPQPFVNTNKVTNQISLMYEKGKLFNKKRIISKSTKLVTFNKNGNFITPDYLPMLINNYSFLNDSLNKILFIFPVIIFYIFILIKKVIF